MGIIVHFLGNGLTHSTLVNILFSGFAGGLIYFALLFLFQEFQPSEKEEMKHIAKKFLPYGLYLKNR